MSSTEKLNAAQARLEGLGYVDLKFFFGLALAATAKSDVENALSSVLNQFIDGGSVESTFDDSYLLEAAAA